MNIFPPFLYSTLVFRPMLYLMQKLLGCRDPRCKHENPLLKMIENDCKILKNDCKIIETDCKITENDWKIIENEWKKLKNHENIMKNHWKWLKKYENIMTNYLNGVTSSKMHKLTEMSYGDDDDGDESDKHI